MHGSETWPMKVEHEQKLSHTEMSMIWMGWRWLRVHCTSITKWLTWWLTIWLSVDALHETLTLGQS